MKVIVLAGGVGGAKMAHGFAKAMSNPDELLVCVNTGDDFEHLGFYISPDIDTVTYTLSGVADASRGWGLAGESWTVLGQLKKLGEPTWFQLGDLDLAIHISRTAQMRRGASLTEATREIAAKLNCPGNVIPMSDDPVRTIVHTKQGVLSFQEYFVRERCEPEVTEFSFDGLAEARPNPTFSRALASPDLELIVIAPSNPFVSIDPILSLDGVRSLIKRANVPVIAVSPIVNGKAVKGPAAKMMKELGIETDATSVAKRYSDILSGFVIDNSDAALADSLQAIVPAVHVCQTIMSTEHSREELAKEIFRFAEHSNLSSARTG